MQYIDLLKFDTANEYYLRLTNFENGGAIVEWQENVFQDEPHTYHAQIYDAGGKAIGDEISKDHYFDVLPLGEGAVALHWTVQLANASNRDHYYQLFDHFGNPIDQIVHDIDDRSLIFFGEGNVFLQWEVYVEEGDYFEGHGQVFDGKGNKIGDEIISSNRSLGVIQVAGGIDVSWAIDGPNNTLLRQSQYFDSSAEPIVSPFGDNRVYKWVSLADGGAFYSWFEEDSAGLTKIHGQFYGSSAQAIGSEIILGTWLDIENREDVGLILKWSESHADSGLQAYKQQLYNSLGQPLGPIVSLDSGVLTDGYFYSRSVEPGSDAVKIQIFNNKGESIGSEILGIEDSKVVRLEDGKFVVTWSDDYEWRGQLYSESLEPIGLELSVPGNSVWISVHSWAGGTYINWQEPDSSYGALERRRYYDPDGNKLEKEIVSQGAYIDDIDLGNDVAFVGWEERSSDGEVSYHGKLFDGSGNPVGTEIVSDRRIFIESSTLTNGNLFVDWVATNSSHAQMFNKAGQPIAERIETSGLIGVEVLPNDGLFTYIYGYETLTGGYGQLYDSDGQPLGDKIFSTGGVGVHPVGDNKYYIIWSEYDDLQSRHVYFGQFYDESGKPLGHKVSPKNYFDVVNFEDGGLIISWEQLVDQGFKRVWEFYDANGIKIESKSTLSNVPSFEVFALENGGRFLVWSQYDESGTITHFGQLYNSSGEKAGAGFYSETEFDVKLLNDDTVGIIRGEGEPIFLVSTKDIFPQGSYTNKAPEGAIGDQTSTVGEIATIDFDDFISDADGDALTYKFANELPSGFTFLSDHGKLIAKVSVDTGTYEFKIIVSDGNGGVIQDNFKWSIIAEEENQPVEINLPWNSFEGEGPRVIAGQAFSIDLSQYAFDPENDPYEFTVQSETLPAGVNFDLNTGILSGKLDSSGSWSIAFGASQQLDDNTTYSFGTHFTLYADDNDVVIPDTLDLEYAARVVAYLKYGENSSVDADYDRLPTGYHIDWENIIDVGGFFAVPIISDNSGPPILAIRGTAEPSDILADLDITGIGAQQVDAAWTEIVAWNKSNPGAMLTGHSLGGAQAQIVVARLGELYQNGGLSLRPVIEVATFNSPGVDEKIVNLYDSLLISSTALNVNHFVARGDIVSMAGEGYIYGDAHVYEVVLSLEELGKPWKFILSQHTSQWAQVATGNQTPLVATDFKDWNRTILERYDGYSGAIGSADFSHIYATGNTKINIYAPYLQFLAEMVMIDLAIGGAAKVTKFVDNFDPSKLLNVNPFDFIEGVREEGFEEYATDLMSKTAGTFMPLTTALINRENAEGFRQKVGMGVFEYFDENFGLKSEALDKIAAFLDGAWTENKELILKVFGAANTFFAELFSFGIDLIVDFAKFNAEQISNIVDFTQDMWALTKEFGADVGKALEIASHWTSEKWNEALDWGTEKIELVKQLGVDTLNSVTQWTAEKWNEALDLSVEVIDALHELGPDFINTISEWDVLDLRNPLSDVFNLSSSDQTLDSGGGDDLVISSFGNQKLESGAGNDSVIDFCGINVITDRAGNDILVGGFQSDTIDGGRGNDRIQGDSSGIFGGSDVLIGGKGDDIIMGGKGADVFVFRPNDGTDVIAEFDIKTSKQHPEYSAAQLAQKADFDHGIDLIQFTGFSDVNSSNVMSFISNSTDGAVFNAEGASILFYGIDVGSITTDNFTFI